MKLLFFLILLLLISCNSNQERLCIIDSSVKTLTDSTLLGDLRQLQIYNDTLYMLDEVDGRIIKLDTGFRAGSVIDFSGLDHTGSSFDPIGIYVDADSIYMMDANVRGIRSLSLKCKHGPITELIGATGTRFFIHQNKFYVSHITEQNCIIVVPEKAALKDTNVVFTGKNFQFTTAKENLNRNNRYLLCGKKHYYAISDNQPIIEKYELETNKLLYSFDFSDVPMIKSNIHFIRSKVLDDNSYYVMIEDAYMYGDAIYLLCATLGNNYERNTIIKVELEPNMHVTGVYRLPEISYTSFCADGSYIYAFSKTNNTLGRFKLNGN